MTTAQDARRRGLGPAARAAGQGRALRTPVVRGSRVISWADGRSCWVRRLHLRGEYSGAFQDFSSEDLGRLVAVVGSSLTKLWIRYDDLCGLSAEPFWELLLHFVVPRGRLRSFVAEGIIADVSESDLEPLGQLAGSLEELLVNLVDAGGLRQPRGGKFRSRRFSESLCALKEPRRLELVGQCEIKTIPDELSSLKKLEELDLRYCKLRSLPKELGELSKPTTLDLTYNAGLGDAPRDEAFPAELAKMKSLRLFSLDSCRPRTVPFFSSELESLEALDVSWNNFQIDAPLDFLIGRCPRLRLVRLCKKDQGGPWGSPESRAHLGAFEAKLLAQNPDAKVEFK